MCAPSAPPPPDYDAAAEASRYNQTTPFGTVTWSDEGAQPGYWTTPTGELIQPPGGGRYNPGGVPEGSIWTEAVKGTPTATMTLPDELQSALSSTMGQVESAYGQPMDLSSIEDVQNQAYGAFTSRLDPMWQQRQDAEIQRLANQGVTAGSEAYTNSMRDLNMGRNDAYQQAMLGAISTMPQTYQLAQAQYMQPLNTLNAMRTGAQIQTPFFSPSGSDALNAAIAQGQYGQGLYNADVGASNAMMAGLFGLGSAAISGYPWGAAVAV